MIIKKDHTKQTTDDSNGINENSSQLTGMIKDNKAVETEVFVTPATTHKGVEGTVICSLTRSFDRNFVECVVGWRRKWSWVCVYITGSKPCVCKTLAKHKGAELPYVWLITFKVLSLEKELNSGLVWITTSCIRRMNLLKRRKK